MSCLVRTRLTDDTVVATISYPADMDSITEKGRARVPYWSQDAVDGLVNYIRQPRFHSVLSGLLQATHPSPAELPVLQPPANCIGWPVVIFSHGLAGCADMYTELCREIASFGYVVVALEHEDGSGCHATRRSDGAFVRYVRPDNTPYSRQKVTSFREAFLEQRVDEVQRVLALLLQDRNEISPSRDMPSTLHNLLRHIDTSRISLAGHSFGAASMLLTAHRLHAQHVGSVEAAIFLDPWSFCLPDTTLAKGCPVPLLSILSEDWTHSNELFAIDKMLEATHTKGMLQCSHFVPGTVHQSFSDTPTWLPVRDSQHLSVRTYTQAATACVS